MSRGEFAGRMRKLLVAFRSRWSREASAEPPAPARDESEDLAAKIQERYGIARESAANDVKEVKERV